MSDMWAFVEDDHLKNDTIIEDALGLADGTINIPQMLNAEEVEDSEDTLVVKAIVLTKEVVDLPTLFSAE